MLACIQIFTGWFLLGLVIETTKLFTWYQFGWPWPSFKVTVVWEIKTCFHFLENIAVDLDEILYVATTSWFVEANAKLILHVIFKGEKSAGVSFIKCMFNISLCQDTCGLVCLKLAKHNYKLIV